MYKNDSTNLATGAFLLAIRSLTYGRISQSGKVSLYSYVPALFCRALLLVWSGVSAWQTPPTPQGPTPCNTIVWEPGASTCLEERPRWTLLPWKTKCTSTLQSEMLVRTGTVRESFRESYWMSWKLTSHYDNSEPEASPACFWSKFIRAQVIYVLGPWYLLFICL